MRGGKTNKTKHKHNKDKNTIKAKKPLKQNKNTIITQIVLTRANKKVPSHAGRRRTQTNTDTIRKQSKCILIKKGEKHKQTQKQLKNNQIRAQLEQELIIN